ncbi:hypothetical protein GCM10027426_09440 [Microbacterium lacusdiani]
MATGTVVKSERMGWLARAWLARAGRRRCTMGPPRIDSEHRDTEVMACQPVITAVVCVMYGIRVTDVTDVTGSSATRARWCGGVR